MSSLIHSLINPSEVVSRETVALKPTIYKFGISLSDLNRGHYETLNLTIAQHPSETVERMMVRVLAYCINANETLEFTKGVSAVDEPDLWHHTLDGQLSSWIDVGEPSVDRIKKATRSKKPSSRLFGTPPTSCGARSNLPSTSTSCLV